MVGASVVHGGGEVPEQLGDPIVDEQAHVIAMPRVSPTRLRGGVRVVGRVGVQWSKNLAIECRYRPRVVELVSRLRPLS